MKEELIIYQESCKVWEFVAVLHTRHQKSGLALVPISDIKRGGEEK